MYPNVISTFIDVATDANGTVQNLVTDKGEILQVLNREGLDGLTPDSIYRSVSIYEPKEVNTPGQAAALLYSCQIIISVKPVTVDKLPDGTAKTDPLNIQSVWKSGNYINLILLPMAKDKSHIFHFIEEGITVDKFEQKDGALTLDLSSLKESSDKLVVMAIANTFIQNYEAKTLELSVAGEKIGDGPMSFEKNYKKVN